MRVEGDTTPCDEQQIHAILKRRLQCKMSRQFQEADQLRDQLSSLGVMVHDREKTWEVKPGFGGAPAQGAYGGNNFGAQPAYAGKPPADYYSAPTGAGGFSSAPPSLNDMATDAQKRIAAAQQAAAAASAGIPPTVAPQGATPYPPPPQRAPAPVVVEAGRAWRLGARRWAGCRRTRPRRLVGRPRCASARPWPCR